MEIWGKIKGYEGRYKVSNEGRVISMRRKRESFLKPQLNNQGYYQVTLDGEKFLVHRLVALAFLLNPENLRVVNHKDTNPKNNSAGNLEWCTQSQNLLCSTKKLGEKAYQAKIDDATARRIYALSKTCSASDIAAYLSVPKNIVNKIIQGHAWNHITGLPRVRFYKLKTAA